VEALAHCILEPSLFCRSDVATNDKQRRDRIIVPLDASIQKVDPQFDTFSGWHLGLLGKTEVKDDNLEYLA